MSRAIDLSKRLSDEDRQYLIDRSRLIEVKANDEEFGRRDAVESHVVIDDGNTGDINPFEKDDGSDLMAYKNLGELGVSVVHSVEIARKSGLSDDEINERLGNAFRTAPGSHDEAASTPEGDTRDYDKDYDEWSKSDLEKEIDERNEDGRDDDARMARSGTKAELAERLNADDDSSE